MIKSKQDIILNQYGNLSKLPEGWIFLSETGFSKRQKIVQELNGNMIQLVKVVTGWTGSRRFKRPILEWAIHPDDLNILNELKNKNVKTYRDLLENCLKLS